MNGPPPEFSRVIDRNRIDAKPMSLEASESERAALAERFGLVSIDALRAEIELDKDGETILATGQMNAKIVQTCAVSGDDLHAEIAEPLDFAFVPARKADHDPDEEIELDAGELDEIEFTGSKFDLGEAIAQSLALAIDPYAEGPNADRIRQEKGLSSDDQPSGPLAQALASLKKS